MLNSKLSEIGTSCITRIERKSIEVLSELSKRDGLAPYSFYNEMPIEIIRYGIALDFAIHHHEHQSKYDKYDFVVCDRHYVCLQAYSLSCGVKDLTLENRVLRYAKEPNLYVYMDIMTNDAINRLICRGNYVEEEENYNLLSSVKSNYLLLLEQKNVLFVGALQPSEVIAEAVRDRVLSEIENMNE